MSSNHQHTMITTLLFGLVLLLVQTTEAHFLFPNVTIPANLLPNSTNSAWDAFRNLSGCLPGQTKPGLAQLKKYFNNFGYYLPTNFSDDFDDALQSALETYQRNFNLNVTGELDQPTLAQIVRPRCGNPDVINGTTTMERHVNGTVSRLRTVSHYSFFPGTPRWPSGTTQLTYAFLPGYELSDSVKAVFARAFDRWSEVIPLTFKETSSILIADIRIGFYRGDHNDGEPFDGVLGTLAHAFSPPSGRFHLDGDENWVVTGDVTLVSVRSAVDLESVAVHEIGHLLGLGHSSVEEAIMYPTISARTKKVALANDDILGIQQLYGSNPSYNGTGTTQTAAQERDSSRVAGSLLNFGFKSCQLLFVLLVLGLNFMVV